MKINEKGSRLAKMASSWQVGLRRNVAWVLLSQRRPARPRHDCAMAAIWLPWIPRIGALQFAHQFVL